MAKEKTMDEVRQQNLEATVSASEEFYTAHKKTIWGIIIAVLVIALGALGYNKFIYQPACEKAAVALYPVEIEFQQSAFQGGDYELALKGDGLTPGFEGIIEEYGSKAGAAVYLYAGICAFKLGDYESAVKYLDSYDGKDPILAGRSLFVKGNAFAAQEDWKAAADCYNAAAAYDNMFSAEYLLNAGFVYEKLGDAEKALEAYGRIKDQYVSSYEATVVDRYIKRIEAQK